MKLHQNIINIIHIALNKIFVEQQLSDKVVPKIIQQKQLGSRDRSLIASTVYDIVRWKRKYDFIADKILLDKQRFNLLIAISLINRNLLYENFYILSLNDDEVNKIREDIDIKIENQSINHSYSEEFYQYALESIGEQWHEIAAYLNSPANVFIHLNFKKIDKKSFLNILDDLNVIYRIPEIPSFIDAENFYGIEIIGKQNLHHTKWFKEKYFYFQDLGSQCVGALLYKYLADKNNLSILDYCAGHGGKSFQLASLIKNSDTIFATDFNEIRFKKLKHNIHQKNIKAIQFNQVSNQLFDAILVDAPCSGSGTFRRQADLKYKITISSVQEKIILQQNILDDVSKLLKIDGILLYATCSILPQENEKQIEFFIKKNPSFIIVEQHTLLLSSYNSDGFFMCVLRKIK